MSWSVMLFHWMFVRLSLITYICGIRGAIFLRRDNKWTLVKEGKPYLISSYKGKIQISLIVANQAKRLINNKKKIVMLVVRPKEDKFVETQPEEVDITIK